MSFSLWLWGWVEVTSAKMHCPSGVFKFVSKANMKLYQSECIKLNLHLPKMVPLVGNSLFVLVRTEFLCWAAEEATTWGHFYQNGCGFGRNPVNVTNLEDWSCMLSSDKHFSTCLQRWGAVDFGPHHLQKASSLKGLLKQEDWLQEVKPEYSVYRHVWQRKISNTHIWKAAAEAANVLRYCLKLD